MKFNIIILIIVFSCLFGLWVYLQLQDIKEDLKICQDLGYDGVKFMNKFSNKVECSNFSELEGGKNV